MQTNTLTPLYSISSYFQQSKLPVHDKRKLNECFMAICSRKVNTDYELYEMILEIQVIFLIFQLFLISLVSLLSFVLHKTFPMAC